MEKTSDAASPDTDPPVKRADLLKRSAMVLFSSVAATAAVESMPLAADAEHVIGFAMVRAASLAVLRNGQQPPHIKDPMTISAFVVLNVPADYQPTGGLLAWQSALNDTELKWLNNTQAAPTVYQIDPASLNSDATKAIRLFGHGGEMRYGREKSGGEPMFDRTRFNANTPPYNDQIYLLVWT